MAWRATSLSRKCFQSSQPGTRRVPPTVLQPRGPFPSIHTSVLPLLRQDHWLSRAVPEGNFSSGALRRSQLAKWLELRKSKWSFPHGRAVTALSSWLNLSSFQYSKHTSENCCFQKRSPESVTSDYRSLSWHLCQRWCLEFLFKLIICSKIVLLLLLLLRVRPRESWEWSAVLEAILWLSGYPCASLPPPFTSSLKLIVNRSWLLSDHGVVMIPTLSRAPDSPPLPIHFASSNGFQMFPCWPEPPHPQGPAGWEELGRSGMLWCFSTITFGVFESCQEYRYLCYRNTWEQKILSPSFTIFFFSGAFSPKYILKNKHITHTHAHTDSWLTSKGGVWVIDPHVPLQQALIVMTDLGDSSECLALGGRVTEVTSGWFGRTGVVGSQKFDCNIKTRTIFPHIWKMFKYWDAIYTVNKSFF